MEAEEKKAFFNDLYQLDHESDGLEEKSDASAVLAKSRIFTSRTSKSKAVDASHPHRPLDRTSSTPIYSGSHSFPGSSTRHQVLRSTADSSNIEATEDQAIVDIPEQPFGNQVGMTTAGRKRKRGQSFDVLPDSQQIFKGLSIFFFPNNDVAPARAFRIRKALERGALWIKTWREGITHVVVDKNLSHKDLLTFLEIRSLPQDIIVVNEDYPADCIRFRFVVNPRRPQYHVKSYEEPKASPPNAPAASSDISLQLRPGKKDLARLRQTSSRSNRSSGPVPVDSSSKPDRDADVTHVSDSVPTSSSKYRRDALSEAIEEAQAIQSLPIDLDEDEDVSKVAFIDESKGKTNDGGQHSESRLTDSSTKTWQQHFICMTRHDKASTPENPNKRTIEVLQQMADYYERTKDHWRTTAYRKAISALKTQSRKITTAEEALAIPFVAQRLADKIEEIVCTDRLRCLDSTKLDVNEKALQNFLRIYGVGYVQATRWIEQGHRSIDDLLSKVELSKNQRIAIEHLDDFQNRIPREEMDQHNEFVCKTVSKIDPWIQCIIGGSYRRGAQDCGDIDFIMTKPHCPIETLRNMMLDSVIPHLFMKGYLKVGLANTRRDDGSKWHGASVLPGNAVWRRIDFLFVPWDELGAAMIYFTGNDIFNRSIRLLASKKGMRLNQHGLWKDVIRGKNREQLTEGSLVEGRDEKRIFELLGVPWRPPEHRIC